MTKKTPSRLAEAIIETADDMRRLGILPPTRLVLELEDFTDEDVAALEKAHAPEFSKDFDRELKS